MLTLSGLPLLIHLKLSGCVRISNKGLLSLASQAHLLQLLHLDKCIKLNDDGMRHLALHQAEDDGMNHLARMTGHVLGLASCPEIGDVGVSRLSTLTSLSSLSLAHCPRVTEEGLLSLDALIYVADFEY
eukprot:gene29802-7438_t